MKLLILAKWAGFEIDSSECYAEITPYNLFLALEDLWEHFGAGYSPDIIYSLNNTFNKISSEDSNILEQLMIDNQQIIDIYEEYKEADAFSLVKEDLIKLLKTIQLLLKHFPQLEEEFEDVVIEFGDDYLSVDLSVTGAPSKARIDFMVVMGVEEIFDKMKHLDVEYLDL